MNNILKIIKTYRPINPAQKEIQDKFILFIENNPDCLLRSNLKGHLTASAFVMDLKTQQVLLIHHKKLDKWLQPGGHCDGDADLLRVAIKEVFEETGLKIQANGQSIKGLDIHIIPEYKGIPEHKHYDVRYIFESDSSLPLIQNHETTGIQWINLEDLKDFINDETVLLMLDKELK